MRKYIQIKLDVEGIHRWDGCNIEEVSYLKYPHRHTFQVVCKIEVTHGDRDIEFIEFKHKIKEYIARKYYDPQYKCCNFETLSCEMIAEDLVNSFNLYECSVSEDGEFWGIITNI